ncbi:hypothetical protein CR513_62510, partial [Mucuna pruriens]
MTMEGKALTWFRWWEENSYTIPSNCCWGTMRDYMEKFEMSLSKVSECCYHMGVFLNGLEDEKSSTKSSIVPKKRLWTDFGKRIELMVDSCITNWLNTNDQ